MNFDQMVIREYLKHNPTLKDAPEVLRSEYYDGRVRGVMRWRKLPDANLYGTAFFNYEIPDLGVLFSGLTITLHVWKPTTHRDVAKVLFETYGVIANLDDIVPTAMSFNPLPDYVDLQTNPRALTLKGTLRVYVLPKVMPLEELVTVHDLDAVVDKYPLSNPKQVNERKYYGYDFTDIRNYMAAITVGSRLSTLPKLDGDYFLNLPSVISEMDGPTWNTQLNWHGGQNWYGPFHVSPIIVLYNGPTSGQAEANKAYTHVCVMNHELSSYDEGENVGKLYLHYNM